MKFTNQLSILLAVFVLFGCAASTNESEANTENLEEMKELSSREVATKAMDAFFADFDEAAIKTYFKEDYIQHNPGFPTGLAPVLGFLPALKDAGTSLKTHRLIQDGDLVVMHNTYDNAEAFGGKELVAFDVFRVEDGKVAEHWDNLQPIVAETTSGRTQFDGPTEITDTDKTAANKAMISSFIDDILMGKNPDKMTDYVSTEMYHQHNPAIGDGLAGLGQAIEYLVSQNDMFVYKTVHKVIGEGNFVLSMSEGEWHGKPHAFYDLFRIADGKIVEHWDVIAEIPAEMAHENGKF